MTKDQPTSAVLGEQPSSDPTRRRNRLAYGLALAALAVSQPGLALAQSHGAAPVQSAAPAASAAQDDSEVGIADVIVTAEKRSTMLQHTPIAVTALAGETLQKAQVHNLVDVQSLVPGVKVGDNNGYAQITVRGVGISGFHPASDSAVAVNVNEVYIARPIAQLTSMFDVSGLEVLRGPQGTLYGRNATAGAVNITTARPTSDWSGYGRASYGNFGAVNLEGAVGGPIVEDKLLFRLAGFVDKNDGRAKNIVTGHGVDDRNARGIRGTLVFYPDPSVTATLIGEHYYERDHAAARHYFGADRDIGGPGVYPNLPSSQQMGGVVAPDVRDIAAGIDPQFRLNTTALTGIVEWSQGPFTVKSVTGWRKTRSDQMSSLDGGSVLVMFNHTGESARQVSEELQLHYDADRLHATGGLYYFNERDFANPGAVYVNTALFGRTPSSFANVLTQAGILRTKAYAAFAQATYDLTDRLSLTAGLRYSEEKKHLVSYNRLDLSLSRPYSFDPANPFYDPTPLPPAVVMANPNAKFTSTTPRIGLQFQATPRVLFYVTYAKGFKSGNFDTIDASPAYGPEKLTDYEGGVKFSTPDNRLRVNLSGYFYNYTDLQVAQVVNITTITSNAGRSHVYGSELEALYAPTDDVTIGLNLAYMHARYKTYFGPDGARPFLVDANRVPIQVDYSGKRLNNAPDFTAHLSIEKRWSAFSGTITLHGEADYSSKFYFTPANYELLGQKAFTKANIFLSYTDNAGWRVTGFVRNVTDRITKTSANVNAALNGAAIEGSIAPPRTYGVEFGYRF